MRLRSKLFVTTYKFSKHNIFNYFQVCTLPREVSKRKKDKSYNLIFFLDFLEF